MSDESDLDIVQLITGIRGVPLEAALAWRPDEGCSWSCIECDYWTPDNPPPDRCPRCEANNA